MFPDEEDNMIGMGEPFELFYNMVEINNNFTNNCTGISSY